MWDPVLNCYRTGTADAQTLNTDPQQVPVDVQAWSVLAIRTCSPSTRKSWHVRRRTTGIRATGSPASTSTTTATASGSKARAKWRSPTPGPAARRRGRRPAQLRAAQQTAPIGDGGGLGAASHDGLTTGFGFVYFRRLHVGTTAWNVFARNNFNPYADGGS